MPIAPLRPATTWIVNTDALNGRTGPSTSKPIKLDSKGRKIILKRGEKVYARREVEGGGRTWLVTRFGTYYAKEYCVRPGARVISPVPGRSVTTVWRKRPAGWPRFFTYWKTRGYHTGSDRAASTGTKVVAVRKGKVVRRWDKVLGNVALLYADNGQTYWYCHLSAYLVKNGATVKAGQAIGRVGATGTGANGPHLHLERRAHHTTSWSGPDLNPETW